MTLYILIAESPKELQTLVNSVQKASSDFGLKINISKTEVQTISKQKHTLEIFIDNHKLQQVHKIVYLEGTIKETRECEDDIRQRMCKALGAVQRLHTTWQSKEIKKKLQQYNTLILPILLYGSETWTLRKSDKNRLLVLKWPASAKSWGSHDSTKSEIKQSERHLVTIRFLQTPSETDASTAQIFLATLLEWEMRGIQKLQ